MENQEQPTIQSQTSVQPVLEHVQTSVEPKKSLSKWPLIVVSVILIATLLTGTYLLVKSQNVNQRPASKITAISPTVSLTPTSTPDPTANWKTFTDTATGLSFKYPPTYTLSNGMNSRGGGQGVALINPIHPVTDPQYAPYIISFSIAGDHGNPCSNTKPNILNLASGKSLDITGCGYNLITTTNVTLGIRVNEVKVTDLSDKTTKEVLQILDSLQNVKFINPTP
jgi:hypothetical protein